MDDYGKELLNHGIGKRVDDGLKYVASMRINMSTNIIQSDDLFEAVTAFTENRKSRFTGK